MSKSHVYQTRQGTVTTKGQVVIPSSIRHHLGIRAGTRVCFIEEEGGVLLRPLTEDYFEKMAGVLKTGGKVTRELLKERARDRAHEDK